MASQRDLAVVLRVRRYSETSQIVTVLGRELGVVRCLAKGALRRTKVGKGKFDGGMDLLDVGEMVVGVRPERELQQMTEWKLVDGHLPLRRDLRGIWLGMYAAELLGLGLQEYDPQAELFDRTWRLLTLLATAQREEVSLAHTLETLRLGGHLPEMTRCVKTRRPIAAEGGPVLFSPRLGGVVSPGAAVGVYDLMRVSRDGLRLMAGIVRLLEAGTPQRMPRLGREVTDPLHAVLATYASHTMGTRLRVPRT